MALNIPDGILAEIRNRLDIVDVIGSYLSLKPKGRNYCGLCPFHAEKTPSFAVNRERQIFHCFGCGVGGDVFGFIVKHEHLSFPEAVKLLADRCGVRLPTPRQSANVSAQLKEKELLYKIHEIGAGFFRRQLWEAAAGEKARRYIEDRGVSGDLALKFGLGYALPEWEGLLQFLVSKGFQPEDLVRAGLVVPRGERSGYYDRFRERLIFPIWNAGGQITGFGGRLLEAEGVPKYLNSPDTPIYHKGKIFYGLCQAREAIKQENQAIIVEGYFDLLAAHQYGFINTVATLGTALTADHVRQLKVLCEQVVILFDADPAGAAAAARSWGLFLESGLQVRVAVLGASAGDNGGADPDTYLREHGPAAFKECLHKSISLVEFVIEQATVGLPLDTVAGQIEASNRVLPVLAQISHPVERASYLTLLAERLHVKQKVLLSELEKAVIAGKKRLPKPESKPVEVIPKAQEVAERLLLGLALTRKPVRDKLLGELKCGDFTTSGYASIFNLIARQGEAGELDFSKLLRDLPTETEKAQVSALLMDAAEEDEEARQIVEDCLRVIKNAQLKVKLARLQQEMVLSGSFPIKPDRQALENYGDLVKKLKMVRKGSSTA